MSEDILCEIFPRPMNFNTDDLELIEGKNKLLGNLFMKY